MLMHIVASTPKWVFVLLFALLLLGLKQMLPSRVSLNRATVIPLAMTVLSLFGVVSAFGDSPLALVAWFAGAAVAFGVSIQMLTSTKIQFDAVGRQFHIPGSAIPLALFMGIFFTKYAVGVSIGMHPSLAQDSNFVLVFSVLYGTSSGIFVARASRLWRMALANDIANQVAIASR